MLSHCERSEQFVSEASKPPAGTRMMGPKGPEILVYLKITFYAEIMQTQKLIWTNKISQQAYSLAFYNYRWQALKIY